MLRMTTDLGWHSALGSLRSRRITLFLELEIVPVSGHSMCLYVSVSTVWIYVYLSLFSAANQCNSCLYQLVCFAIFRVLGEDVTDGSPPFLEGVQLC